MLLNVENYERMAGPNSAYAGIKVVIYNPNSIPLVSYNAIDLPPGFHSQIAIQYIEVR